MNTHFMRNLSNDEIGTVFGATIDTNSTKMPVETGTGPYAPTEPSLPELPPLGSHR